MPIPSSAHRPGRPQDLPDPSVLWRHGAVAALVHALMGEPTEEWLTGYWLTDGRGVGHDDWGGNWWNLQPLPGGRAVLYGEDHEGSRTRWHNPPVDPVEGAPEWLPLDRLRSMDDMLGYVYWFDGASWDRVAYPERVSDDGLELTAGRFLTADLARYEVTEVVASGIAVSPDGEARFARALLEAAERREITPDLLHGLVEDLLSAVEEDGEPPSMDPDAALDVARRAGFTPGGA